MQPRDEAASSSRSAQSGGAGPSSAGEAGGGGCGGSAGQPGERQRRRASERRTVRARSDGDSDGASSHTPTPLAIRPLDQHQLFLQHQPQPALRSDTSTSIVQPEHSSLEAKLKLVDAQLLKFLAQCLRIRFDVIRSAVPSGLSGRPAVIYLLTGELQGGIVAEAMECCGFDAQAAFDGRRDLL